jgi:hypothetical protein
MLAIALIVIEPMGKISITDFSPQPAIEIASKNPIKTHYVQS